MANNQTYIDGIGNTSGTKITDLTDIKASGLSIPQPTNNFIDIRRGGKIEELFLYNNNPQIIYDKNKLEGLYYKDIAVDRLEYKDPLIGQKTRNSIDDAAFITSFLGSTKGLRFITRQLLLQGTQPFDETKLYNPVSPILGSLQPGMFGLLDRPTRHIDTSNVVGGIASALGVGGIVSTVGSLITGNSEALPAPPRSSVASEASEGFGIKTLSSLVGGGDRSDEVVTPLARDSVKGLLRGGTATSAYTAKRYSKYVPSAGTGILGRLLNSAVSYISTKTAIGSLVNPTQPWAAQYRADEKTYDYMLSRGGLYFPEGVKTPEGGILSSIKNALGFGEATSYESSVPQRFFNKSETVPSYGRLGKSKYAYKDRFSDVGFGGFYNIDQVGILDNSGFSSQKQSLSDDITVEYNKSFVDGDKEKTLKYTQLITRKSKDNKEQSDILYAYKDYISQQTEKSDDPVENAKVDFYSQETQKLYLDESDTENQNKESSNLTETYKTYSSELKPSQDSSFENAKYDFFKKEKPDLYFDKFSNKIQNDYQNIVPTVTDFNTINSEITHETSHRNMSSTNTVNYINKLTPLKKEEFTDLYLKNNNGFGPDFIKFYFYDIVNQIYIPFNATITGLQDNNTATWQKIEYIGRADTLYFYSGFTRDVSFKFHTVAGSIYELLPMWTRINYLVGLTRPANYTMQDYGGGIVAPFIQFTLGDMYKNHFAVINSANVTIPEDATWELYTEEKSDEWSYGKKGVINIKENLKGNVAQYPICADISISLSILEKDKPRTGRGIWGDAPVISQISNSGRLYDNFNYIENENSDVESFSFKIRTATTNAEDRRNISKMLTPRQKIQAQPLSIISEGDVDIEEFIAIQNTKQTNTTQSPIKKAFGTETSQITYNNR